MVAHATQSRRARQKGQDLLEFTFMVFVILGFIYMILDISWMVFTRATLQYAAREGCRYAAANGYDNPTYSPANTAANETASILTTVEANSLGFLSATTPACTGATPPATGFAVTPCISVTWYSPAALNTPLTTGGTPDVNESPNVVEVDIVQFPQTPLFGIFTRDVISTFYFNAASADVME